MSNFTRISSTLSGLDLSGLKTIKKPRTSPSTPVKDDSSIPTPPRLQPRQAPEPHQDLGAPQLAQEIAHDTDLVEPQQMLAQVPVVPVPVPDDHIGRLLKMTPLQLKFVKAMRSGDPPEDPNDPQMVSNLKALDRADIDIPNDDQLKSLLRLQHEDESLQDAFVRIDGQDGLAQAHDSIKDLSDKELKMLKAFRQGDEPLSETRQRLKDDIRGGIKPHQKDLQTGIKALAKRREALTNPDIELGERAPDDPGVRIPVDTGHDNSLKRLLRSEISELKAGIKEKQPLRSRARARVSKHSSSIEGLERLLKKERAKTSPNLRRIRKMETQLSKERRQLQVFSMQFEMLERDLISLKKQLTQKQAVLSDVTARPPGHKIEIVLKNEHNVFRKKIHEIVDKVQRDLAVEGGHEHLSTWESVKRGLLESEGSLPFMMFAMTDFRKDYVQTLVGEVVKDVGKKGGTDTIAAGSTNLTSDFDMRVETRKIGHDTKVMQEFNARFRADWGSDSGSIFDTNLYTRGTVPDFIEEDRTGVRQPTFTDPTVQERHDFHQDVLALAKQRRYMSQDDWDSYTRDLANSLAPPHDAALRKLHKAADDLHKEYQGEMEKALKNLKTDLANRRIGLEAFVKRLEHTLPPGPDKEAKIEGLQKEIDKIVKVESDPEALEMIASNKLYEKHLKAADSAVRKAPTPSHGEKDHEEALWLHGKSLLYANEPIFSQGTMRDVVLNQQAIPMTNKHKGTDYQLLDISGKDALQSMNENLGDVLKDFKHYGHISDEVPTQEQISSKLGEGVYHASKYLSRMCKAMDMLIERSGQDGNPALTNAVGLKTDLQSIVPQLMEIRKGSWEPELDLPPDTSPSDRRKAVQEAKNAHALEILKSCPRFAHLQSLDQLQTLILTAMREVNSVTRPHI